MSPISQTNSDTTPTSTSAQSAAQTAAAAADPLASESTFLTLLVSQLKNQDPLNPTDSTQFVSQLTAYSQLEQLIDIKANTTPVAAPAATTTATTPASTTPATGTGN